MGNIASSGNGRGVGPGGDPVRGGARGPRLASSLRRGHQECRREAPVLQEGAAVLAIDAQVPLVPVAVAGANEITPKGGLWVRSGRPRLSSGWGSRFPPRDWGETTVTRSPPGRTDAVAHAAARRETAASGRWRPMAEAARRRRPGAPPPDALRSPPLARVPIGDAAPGEVDGLRGDRPHRHRSSTSSTRRAVTSGSTGPQRYSSSSAHALRLHPPDLLRRSGAARAAASGAGLPAMEGDGDPMDICVLSERDVSHSGVLLRARPIGGLRMIDGNRGRRQDHRRARRRRDLRRNAARRRRVAPRAGRAVAPLLLTYKQMPGRAGGRWRSARCTTAPRPMHMVRISQADYVDKFGDPRERERYLLLA